MAFSKLHKEGALIIAGRGKPRSYRLLDPRNLTLRMSGAIKSGLELEQEQYVQLIHDAFRVLRERLGIVSFCVYGSVARGEAKPLSDLDILLVSDEFRGSLASRIDSLSFVDAETRGEVDFLRSDGYITSLSLLPLRKEEAEAAPAILLDLTVNSKILYDENDFLKGILVKLRAGLELAGARRISTKDGWYWDLKPGYRPGEEVLVP